MNQKRITALLCWCILLVFSAGSALAAVDKVRCILWQGDVTKFHTALEVPVGDEEPDPYTTWDVSNPNELQIVFSGGTYVSWARVVVTQGGVDTTYCVYDATNGGTCSTETLCDGTYSGAAFDQSVSIPAGAKPERITLEVVDSCSSGNYQVSLNGTLIDTISANAGNECSCSSGVYSDILAQEDTSNLYSTRLKGVVTTTDTSSVWYKWVFGDGTESAVTELSGATEYNVEIEHEYTGAVGTPYTALLYVDDIDNTMANAVSDRYLVKIAEDTLDYRVNKVIDEGLWYLYKNQLSGAQSNNGKPVAAWSSYSTYHPSATGAALQAFEINNHKATGNFDEDPYSEVVAAGLNWLLTGSFNGTQVLGPITLTANNTPNNANADMNGNGIGVQVAYPGYPAYQGGIVMDAIISSGTPNADSNRDFDNDGVTDTYQQVIQDMVDAYAWGQSNNASGGWSYNWNPYGTDNSTNQWAAIGLIPALNDFGCTMPQFVTEIMDGSLTYTYSAANRWFGYTSSTPLSNVPGVTRPSGMVQMILAVPDYKTDERWIGPESYYAEHFAEEFSTGHRTYYGWLSFVKAMILSGTETLSNGINWYRGSGTVTGLAQLLVDEHEADGSWPQDGQWTHPGYYGETFVTSWAIQMLKPALFQAAPIACFTASPNPTYADKDITFDPGCTDHSDSAKDISNIVSFEWDWEHDGIYDTTSAGPDIQTHAFTCDSLPCTYPVVLRVTDDEGIPATFSMNINITNPPHPPEADAGGPYIVSLCDGDSLVLDGSNSIEPNEGTHQAGCNSCADDTITAWEWDLEAPLNDFSNESGETVTLNSARVDALFDAGTQYTIGLKVTDNTALAYPDSGDPNLTDVDFATVDVFTGCACDLAVTQGCASLNYESVILNWAQVGTYEVLRSETGPNSGFEKIADVDDGSSYEDVTAVFNTRYWYRLQGDNCLSTAVMIDYAEEACGGGFQQCFDDLTAISKSRKVQLEWACHQDADGYNVYRSTSPNVELIEANKIADGYTSIYCAFTDRSVTNGTTYYYKITKVIGGQEICMSNEVDATPAVTTFLTR
nr:hypothetical protein [uncultured Desulfobacter sp.]